MTPDFGADLIELNVACAAAVAGVLMARPWVRNRFGAQAAYRLWLAPVVVVLATLAPPRQETRPVSAPVGIEASRPEDAPVPALSGPSSAGVSIPMHAPTSRPWDATAAMPAGLAAADVRRGQPRAAPSASGGTDARAGLDLAAALWGAWALGALVMAALTGRLQRSSLARLGRLSVSGDGSLRGSAAGSSPVIVGAFRPRLILPWDFETRFSAEERALILAHERHHLNVRDPLVNAAVALVRCLLWFNPAIHLAALALRRDQELACDAAVMDRHPRSALAYARALYKAQMGVVAAPIGCSWGERGDHPLVDRIKALSSARPTRICQRLGAAVVAVISVAGAATAWAAQAPTFVDAPGVTSGPSGFTDGGAETTRDLDVGASLALSAQTGDAANLGAFAADTVELRSVMAILKVLPEDRGDIAVSVQGGTSQPARSVQASLIDGGLVIDGGLGEAPHRCRARFTGQGAAVAPGLAPVPAADLPVIILHTPRDLKLVVRGVVAAEIGDLRSGDIRIDGCGDARIGDVARDLTVTLNGFGDVDVGQVSGGLAAALEGVGDLTIRSVRADAALRLAGEGDLTTGALAGALDARMIGGGVMTVASVGAGATVRAPGSGRVDLGPVKAYARIEGDGSSHVRMASLDGAVLDAALTGSIWLTVSGGRIDRLNARLSGSSILDFGGQAGTVDADVRDSARQLRSRRTPA